MLPVACLRQCSANGPKRFLSECSRCVQLGSYIHCILDLVPCDLMSCTTVAATALTCKSVYLSPKLWKLWGHDWYLIHFKYTMPQIQCLSYLIACYLSVLVHFMLHLLRQWSCQGCSSAVDIGAMDSGSHFLCGFHLCPTHPMDSVMFIEQRIKGRDATLKLVPFPCGCKYYWIATKLKVNPEGGTCY